MNKRKLGRFDLQVSEIALGCEGFLDQTQAFTDEIIDVAIAHGVNFIDLYSPNPDMHQRIGRSLGARRKDFIIQGHLCTIWERDQYRATRNLKEVQRSFELMLTNLQTDYLDVGMIHYVDSEATWNQVITNGILDYALTLRQEGKIKHIGLSSHNPIVALKAIESGVIDVLMFSVNPCYDLLPGDEDVDRLFDTKSYDRLLFNFDPMRVKLYDTCQRLGVAITVMKAFGGGELLSDASPAGKALSVHQCLHYALDRPSVAAVMVGVHSLAELQDALAYEDASDSEKDYATVLASFPRIKWEGHCMYCGHCAPCPQGISVANVMKLLNLAQAQDTLPETVREHYRALDKKASDCLDCHACERRCPFGVRVVEKMSLARQVFHDEVKS